MPFPACRQHKVVYLSEREARTTAKRAENTYGQHMKPYRCRFCGQWHLTSWR